MNKTSTSSVEALNARLKIKTQLQQLKIAVVKGANLSQWEAEVLTDIIDETIFRTSDAETYRSGQIKYSCIRCDEPAGKPLDQCAMVTVRLTLLDAEDRKELCGKQSQRSSDMRRRRLQRIVDEAMDQGGLLSQEDLAELLMCDVRTIRRDIRELKDQGIVMPTRGIVKDIGPGVTHKELAIRKWLEGKEPTEIALAIHHSLKATENYLEKFKRVCYLEDKHFTIHEMARVIGISIRAVRTFKDIREEFKNKALYKLRMEEIKVAGHEFWQGEGEKKSSSAPSKSAQGR